MFRKLGLFFLSMAGDPKLWIVIINKEAVIGTFNVEEAIEFANHYNIRKGKEEASVSKLEILFT